MGNYRDKWLENNDSNYGWYYCSRCGTPIRKSRLDIDHIIPRSKGGGDSLFNLQGMCQHCNRSKKDDVGLHTAVDLTRNTVENTIKTAGVLFSLFKK